MISLNRKRKLITEKWMPVLEAGDKFDTKKYNQASQMFESMQTYFDKNIPEGEYHSFMSPTILVPTFRRLIGAVDNFHYINEDISPTKIGFIINEMEEDMTTFSGLNRDCERVGELVDQIIKKFGKDIVIGKNPVTVEKHIENLDGYIWKRGILYVSINPSWSTKHSN